MPLPNPMDPTLIDPADYRRRPEDLAASRPASSGSPPRPVVAFEPVLVDGNGGANPVLGFSRPLTRPQGARTLLVWWEGTTLSLTTDTLSIIATSPDGGRVPLVSQGVAHQAGTKYVVYRVGGDGGALGTSPSGGPYGTGGVAVAPTEASNYGGPLPDAFILEWTASGTNSNVGRVRGIWLYQD